jgi:hypothetical protein
LFQKLKFWNGLNCSGLSDKIKVRRIFMKKQLFLFGLMAFFAAAIVAPVFGQAANRSYYVRADGDNENNGRSEEAALRTLQKALSLASQGAVKTITIIGKIGGGVIDDRDISTDAEIFITGKTNAPEEEKAVIGALSIRGSRIHLRFENIAITGNYYGNVLNIAGATIKIGTGVKISSQDNTGSENNRRDSAHGISLDAGTLIMDDGEISGNAMGGISIVRGTFTMNGGTISHNTAYDGYGKPSSGGGISNGGIVVINGGTITQNSGKNGGGIFNAGTLTIKGGSITQNKAEYGAGIYQNNGTFIIEKGNISTNEADFVGGGLYVKKGATFTQKGNNITGNTAGDGEGENVFIQE